ncbi:MAG: endogenous inhibitor of DNA gyrase (YacG/DUF329 family) [Gammaproteobacteria bacterium]|jgi:endogenous inhibitor of DNA gyrase (YacG/DUF329 family)
MSKIFSCPNCKKISSLEIDNPWRPFCSERCRLIDLGDWMDENNKLPSEQTEFFNLDSEEDDVRH